MCAFVIRSLLQTVIIDEHPNTKLIEAVIAAGPAALDVVNNRGLTALHLAVLTDQPDVVRLLVVGGASADVRELLYGDNAALMACRHGRGPCLAAIIDGLKERPVKTVSGGHDSWKTELADILQATDYNG